MHWEGNQFLASPLLELEDELPSGTRAMLGELPLLSDAELWRIANDMMHEEKQSRFETLIAQSKLHTLTDAEQTELNNLFDEAQQLMLCKAEAYRLLARRGHVVFP